MYKIVFFSIPAHGHTNPTIPLVKELVERGHEVWYYSFLPFQKNIEEAGARFIGCDEFLPKISDRELKRKAGKDFAALIEMVADTTIAMEDKVYNDLTEFAPDCIVSDSMSIWGRLFANRLKIPYICSTTTFAFNQHTAKLMKQSWKEIFKMVVGIPRINKKMKLLRAHGYEVSNFISLIQNDNDTTTIVYTSKEFQPLVETFSENYTFVGPSILEGKESHEPNKGKKTIYISLGTVLHDDKDFYRNCIEALRENDYNVIMSIGDEIDITSLGEIPSNFVVQGRVNQTEILQKSNLFITHCGMNSVNESLYYGVPMVLYPLQSEQGLVANRVEELGAGIKLTNSRPPHIKHAVEEIANNASFKQKATSLSENFRAAGGAQRAADTILNKIKAGEL